MPLSALEHLKTWGCQTPPFLRPFPPLYAPFYSIGGLDWTNILKLKVLASQNAITHASICSRTCGIEMSRPYIVNVYIVLCYINIHISMTKLTIDQTTCDTM